MRLDVIANVYRFKEEVSCRRLCIDLCDFFGLWDVVVFRDFWNWRFIIIWVGEMVVESMFVYFSVVSMY